MARRAFVPAVLSALIAAACRPSAEGTPEPDTAESDVPIPPANCRFLHDRPPGDGEPWLFDGPRDADVAWGLRPATTWDGPAMLLLGGPKGGCRPCTVTGGGFGGEFATPQNLAIELELGCGAENALVPENFGYAGLRLHLQGPPQDLPDGSHGPLEVDLPLHLFGADAGRCLVDNSAAQHLTAGIRDASPVLQPGRYLPYRIPVSPLLAEQGFDAVSATVSWYKVILEVHDEVGSMSWIEVGRTLMDGCP